MVKVIIFFFKLLPYKTALKCGKFIGTLAFAIDKRHREIALLNLQNAFKDEKSTQELQEIVKSLYHNLGKMLVEFIWLSDGRREIVRSMVKIQGKENLIMQEKMGWVLL